MRIPPRRARVAAGASWSAASGDCRNITTRVDSASLPLVPPSRANAQSVRRALSEVSNNHGMRVRPRCSSWPRGRTHARCPVRSAGCDRGPPGRPADTSPSPGDGPPMVCRQASQMC